MNKKLIFLILTAVSFCIDPALSMEEREKEKTPARLFNVKTASTK